MSTVQIVTVGILALEMADASRRPKGKTQGIGNVGGLGLGPNMAIVPFIHALHGSSLGLGGGRTNWREYEHASTIELRREETDFLN